jgi:hypothetical protein
VKLLDDGARGAGGGEDAVPAEDVEAGEAGFGDGGKVGRGSDTLKTVPMSATYRYRAT